MDLKRPLSRTIHSKITLILVLSPLVSVNDCVTDSKEFQFSYEQVPTAIKCQVKDGTQKHFPTINEVHSGQRSRSLKSSGKDEAMFTRSAHRPVLLLSVTSILTT